MKILVSIGHPAHVHFFKNTILILKNKGHEIKVSSTEKDNSLYLLDKYNIKYDIVGKNRNKFFSKILNAIKIELKLYTIAKKFNPDICIGASGNFYITHAAWLMNRPSIVFEDTEHSIAELMLCSPFAHSIVTPGSFKKNLGIKQLKYDGFKELAYLHPKYFKPDPSVLEDLGLSKSDKFIIIRFVAWNAVHDMNQYGISDEMKLRYISEMEKYGRVFISSEAKLKKNFEKYSLSLEPERFHSMLYYAQLYLGEGGTTATEAAILGTPSIHISTTARFCGNFDELDKKYGLIHTFSDDKEALKKALCILKNPNSKKEWIEKRDKMLKEKIDVTDFMVKMIENFPVKKD